MKCYVAIVAGAILLAPLSSYAEGDTPVTAIANPQATSSGSVTNQAVQVLQGPYVTNTYGGGVQCQGPTLNFTPFISSSLSGQTPFERRADLDGDGIDDRTGQKDNWSFNPGASLTVSFPLDGGLQEMCKDAARTWTARQQAETDKARLDFELVRLLRCGEAAKNGVMFHPDSPYASICSDVVVVSAPTLTSSAPSSTSSPNSSQVQNKAGLPLQ